jgi:lysophospholipase L1-like esterase
MRSPLFTLALLAAAIPSVRAADTLATRPIKIVLVGDSTVADRTGWGLGFKAFLDERRAECINTAAGGRSSMSFIKEGRWSAALALQADYYLIQFGHNDEPGKPGRSTEIDDYRRDMQRYVDDARAIGAKPILVTSLVRRQFDHDDPHKIRSSLVPRVNVVKEIAAITHVPLVDLHQRSLELCERLGREACYDFSPKKPDGSFDGTHLNAAGSVLFARLVIEELRRVAPELDPVLRHEPGPLPTPAAPAAPEPITSEP